MDCETNVCESATVTLPPIKGFLPNTLLDWPGRICAIVFLPGCGFRCPYCHARELVADPAALEQVPIEAVLDQLRAQRKWVDGVVITGGEPLGQPHLADLIRLLREQGLGIKLDTNGSRPEPLERLIDAGLVDYVAMDVKAPLDERYHKVAGVQVDLDAIRRSIDLLEAGRVDYEFRTTYCPALLSEQDVVALAGALRSAKRWYIQPFRPVNCLARWLERTERPSEGQMERLVSQCRAVCSSCRQRGRW